MSLSTKKMILDLIQSLNVKQRNELHDIFDDDALLNDFTYFLNLKIHENDNRPRSAKI